MPTTFPTMQPGMRYIGGKTRLLDFIQEAWSEATGGSACLAGDLFCGSGAVTAMLKRLGNRVHANDNLQLAAVLAGSILCVSAEPEFVAVQSTGVIAPPSGMFGTSYDAVLEYLNSLPPREGFFFREYSPEGSRRFGTERRYFTSANAKKIDAIRAMIAEWVRDDLLTRAERDVLLADLIRATNRVANIAGTYGCFIKHWDQRALKPIRLTPAPIIPGTLDHIVTCDDAFNVAKEYTFDAVYLDPPYTWRHYGAYYHVLETIARGDEPVLSGSTGLRPWHDTKSRYCDREDAEHALDDLVGKLKAEHIFLSYNSDGLIEHSKIMEILRLRGMPTVREMDFPRYRSNSGVNGLRSHRHWRPIDNNGNYGACPIHDTYRRGCSIRDL